ncbi:MAG: fused MFS/spermidine synthase [Verrucomicrobiia bacterium]
MRNAAAALPVATLTAVLALGISSVVTQLALMREMLGVFAGNELVLGIVLGNWLLLMGLGASLARRMGHSAPSPGVLGGCLVITALVPSAQILVLRALRSLVFRPGEGVGVVSTVVTAFLILLPFCLTAGFALSFACRMWQGEERAAGAGKVYLMDSLGSVGGGVLFTFVLVVWLDHIAMLAVPALLSGLAAAWLAWTSPASSRRRLLVILSFAAALGVPGWILLSHPDASSTARQFPNQHLLFRGSSPYGRVLVTKSGGQTNFIANGTVLASTPNIEQAEESVHFAMAQRPESRHVLLIGGALSGAARELLRYGIERLDCVELDPLITSLGRQFLPAEFADTRMHLFETDAREFVRRATSGYDVVVLALPDPSTAQINRFFTDEFFADVRRVLRPGGLLSFAVGQYANFASPELSAVLSCARRTAAQSFPNVLLLPAGRVWFLASDRPFSTDFAAALERTELANAWVNRNYVAAMLTPDRIAAVERAATQPAPVNHDFAPALYFLHLRHWASQFESKWRPVLVVTAIVAGLWMLRMGAVGGALFASGYAGSALEVILLLAVQTLVGAVYQQVAWVVTLFMAGLALGAWITTRWLTVASRVARTPRQMLGWLALSIAVIAGAFPGVLFALARWTASGAPSVATQSVLLVFTFGLAALVGAQFPVANQALQASTSLPAARLFNADFVGASAGALLASAFLLPLAGVSGTAWSAAGLNLVAGVVLIGRKNSP